VATPRPVSGHLVGRRRERAALDRIVGAGFTGVPGVALIVGEAGIGKSTLAADVAASARAGGARVVYGAADEVDRSAFGLWQEPWARLGGAGKLVDPDLGHDDQRWDVLARLSELLSGGAPVLVVLEDLHWTDSLSSWVVARLAAGLAGEAVALVATTRPDGADRLVGLLRPAEVVRLGGLDEAEVAELAHVLAPGAAVDASALLVRTGGNPLFVRELVRAPDVGMTAVVGSTLEHALTPLSASTRSVLAVLALAGSDAPVGVVAGALGATPSEVVAAFDEAVARDVLVRRSLGAVAFRHALLSEAATASIPDGELRRQHADLARAWRTTTAAGAAARAARHLVAAVPVVDAATATEVALATATDMVHAGDVTGAADLLEALASVLDAEGGVVEAARRARMLLELAAAREAAGDVVAATDTFEAAAREAGHAGDAELVARAEIGAARRMSMWVDDPDRRRRLETAAERLPPGDHPLRVELYGRLAVLSLVRRDLATDGIRWGDAAVAMAHRLGDPGLVATALIDRHLAPVAVEDLRTRAEVSDELLAAAARAGRPDLVLVALEWQYSACLGRGDLAGAEDAVRRLEALGAVMPSPLWRYGALLRRAVFHALAGQRDLAFEYVEEAQPLGSRVLAEHEAVGLDTGIRAVIAVVFGFADPRLVEFVPRMAQLPMRTRVAFFDVRYGMAAMAVGSVEEARAVANRWAPRPSELLFGYQSPTTVALLGNLVADLGLQQHASAVHAVLAPYAGWLTLETGFGITVPADLVLGRLALLAGDAVDAVRSLGAAAELTRRLPAAALEARCRWHLAEALTAVGDLDDAAVARREAEALAARTGVVLVPPTAPAARRAAEARLRRNGRSWRLESPLGPPADLAHSTGLVQLARVLAAAPGEVEAVELAGGRGVVVEHDLGPALDAAAKRAYRQRLAELRAEIDEADDHADIERAARARVELDALMTELQRAVGLGGRDRPTASSTEKARINVARSIRRAITAVAAVQPALGVHLEVSVRTGRTCRYAPDPAAALAWTVET
jgi:hypothetical protein